MYFLFFYFFLYVQYWFFLVLLISPYHIHLVVWICICKIRWITSRFQDYIISHGSAQRLSFSDQYSRYTNFFSKHGFYSLYMVFFGQCLTSIPFNEFLFSRIIGMIFLKDTLQAFERGQRCVFLTKTRYKRYFYSLFTYAIFSSCVLHCIFYM